MLVRRGALAFHESDRHRDYPAETEYRQRAMIERAFGADVEFSRQEEPPQWRTTRSQGCAECGTMDRIASKLTGA